MTEQRTVELSELLTAAQLAAVYRIISEIKLGQTSEASLKLYLRSISSELESKGVHSDYLFYALVYSLL